MEVVYGLIGIFAFILPFAWFAVGAAANDAWEKALDDAWFGRFEVVGGVLAAFGMAANVLTFVATIEGWMSNDATLRLYIGVTVAHVVLMAFSYLVIGWWLMCNHINQNIDNDRCDQDRELYIKRSEERRRKYGI